MPIAVITMFFAQKLEQRMGAAAAGWFAALPIAFGVAAATIAVTGSTSDAYQSTLSAAGHTGPMIAYAVAFVALTAHLGAVQGFLLAAPIYVLASLLFRPVPEDARVVIGILAIGTGALYMSRQPRPVGRSGQASTTTQQVLSLTSAGVAVALISAANQLAGPNVAGAVGAFPVMTTTMALFIAHRSGARFAGFVMQGLVKSLPIYMTYCLVFMVTITRVGVLWAVVTSTALALVVAALTWSRVAQAEISDHLAVYAEP